jgi:hypothetical protein
MRTVGRARPQSVSAHTPSNVKWTIYGHLDSCDPADERVKAMVDPEVWNNEDVVDAILASTTELKEAIGRLRSTVMAVVLVPAVLWFLFLIFGAIRIEGTIQ